MIVRLFTITFILMMLWGCDDPVYTPKPRTYPRVVFPEKGYKTFDKDYCCFTFEAPVYTTIEKDTSFFKELPPDPCWFDIYYPDFDCRVYCSYLPVDKSVGFDKFKSDAFNMAEFHNKKANYIDEKPIQKANGVKGMFFEIDGPVASPLQFYLTDDAERHFFRGSVYFNTRANQDSLAPITKFVKEDVLKLIDSFSWNDAK